MIDSKKCSTWEMLIYSTGDFVNALTFNSIANLGMLYYTDALGFSPSLAGLAISIAIFWDAITDPVMGHITDNTRSRWGRRHPYLLIGGIGLILTFFFFWRIPGVFKISQTILFCYLITINLLLRTFYTIYFIPYGALGFEICTDYSGRTKLQSLRSMLNILANLLGPALAWTLFFTNHDGTRATNETSNYINMASWFSVAAVCFVIVNFFGTIKYAQDSRNMKITGQSFHAFLVNMKEIILDKISRWVFVYSFFSIIGFALVSILQMYFYEHFLGIDGWRKTFCHGGTMVGWAAGSLAAIFLVSRIDKKPTVIIGGLFCISSKLVLVFLFLGKFLKPSDWVTLGVFAPIDALFWFGVGMISPVIGSMMADVSEINEIRTGVNKDGGYSAMMSFSCKLATSVSVILAGFALGVIGLKGGSGVHNLPIVINNLCALTLLAGPVIAGLALIIIFKYPINKSVLEEMRRIKTCVPVQKQ